MHIMLVRPSWQFEVNKNKHWEYQAPIDQHWSLLGLTKLILQQPHLQHKDSSGLYYTHGDSERPSDMPPSSYRLHRGSQLHLDECSQGVS